MRMYLIRSQIHCTTVLPFDTSDYSDYTDYTDYMYTEYMYSDYND